MKKIVSALLVFAPLCAYGDWVKVTSALNGAGDIYVDPTTISKTGDVRQALELLDRSTPDQGVLSVTAVLEFDCKDKKLRHNQTTAYSGHMAKGDILGIGAVPDAWQNVASGTVDEVAMNYVCSN